jgi:hypothetical protein
VELAVYLEPPLLLEVYVQLSSSSFLSCAWLLGQKWQNLFGRLFFQATDLLPDTVVKMISYTVPVRIWQHALEPLACRSWY